MTILYSEQSGCCAGCFKPLGEDVHVDHVERLRLAAYWSKPLVTALLEPEIGGAGSRQSSGPRPKMTAGLNAVE